MGQRVDGDVQRFRDTCATGLARLLAAQVPAKTSNTRVSFENFAIVLSLIPDLRSWSSAEKQHLLEIIGAHCERDEMRYLHLLQGHTRLRESMLKLGSRSPADQTC